MHYAIFSGSEKIIELFISSGVNLKTKDQYGLTPLVYALKAKNKIIINMLKSAGGRY
jgi:ankyrin repeat protein